MNGRELIHSLMEETGLPRKTVSLVIKALPDIVADYVREGEPVSMRGFGSFTPWQQSERLARNPKTGDEVTIQPRLSIKFKPGSDLMKKLNE